MGQKSSKQKHEKGSSNSLQSSIQSSAGVSRSESQVSLVRSVDTYGFRQNLKNRNDSRVSLVTDDADSLMMSMFNDGVYASSLLESVAESHASGKGLRKIDSVDNLFMDKHRQ